MCARARSSTSHRRAVGRPVRLDDPDVLRRASRRAGRSPTTSTPADGGAHRRHTCSGTTPSEIDGRRSPAPEPRLVRRGGVGECRVQRARPRGQVDGVRPGERTPRRPGWHEVTRSWPSTQRPASGPSSSNRVRAQPTPTPSRSTTSESDAGEERQERAGACRPSDGTGCRERSSADAPRARVRLQSRRTRLRCGRLRRRPPPRRDPDATPSVVVTTVSPTSRPTRR